MGFLTAVEHGVGGCEHCATCSVEAARSVGKILLLSVIEVVKLNCCGVFLLVAGSQSCLAG